MKKFLAEFFVIFAVLALFSCSKKEDPIVESTSPFTLTLKSDVGENQMEVIGVNTVVTFTVIGSDGEDYTDASQLFVNEVEISGSTYEFVDTGAFSVKATLDDVVSNTLNFEILEPTERILVIDVPKALRNQTITFGLLDYKGNNTASEAIFYVEDNAIEGTTFTSSIEGSFVVKAEYTIDGSTYTTENKLFEVFIPKRKVVIEDYTGTWCGFCPAVAVAIDDARNATKDIAVVAIHKTASTIPDPMDFGRIQELQDMFDVGNGFPKAQINRTVSWPDPYPLGQITSMAGTNTDVSIAVSSSLNGSNLSVKVDVVYENGSTSGDKLVVYLLENGIVAPQANYFDQTPGHPYHNLGNPIMDYVHNDALRNSLSDLFGDTIPNTPAFEVFTKEYSFSVPADYVGENLSFVVMVVNADNSAKNAQFASVNEKKDYE